MIISFPNITAILRGRYRLHFQRSLPEAYFREQIASLTPSRLRVQRRFQTNSMPVFSLRQQWYEQLIRQDEILFSNNFIERLNTEKDSEHKEYLIYIAGKELINLMKEVQQLPENLQKHTLEDVFGLKTADILRIHQDEEQIIRLIKAVLAALYLDIQTRSKSTMQRSPIMDEKAIYKYIYLEEMEDGSLIKEADYIPVPLTKVQIKDDFVFVPLRGDREDLHNLKVRYEDIVKSDAFFSLEEILFEYGLLNRHGHFIKNKSKSHNKAMAAVYHRIVDLNFFRKTNLNAKKEIKPPDIRAYLDRRYASDLTQEFRKFSDKDMEAALIKLPFLDHDPRFR